MNSLTSLVKFQTLNTPLKRFDLSELSPANPPRGGFAKPVGRKKMKLKGGVLHLATSSYSPTFAKVQTITSSTQNSAPNTPCVLAHRKLNLLHCPVS